MNTRTGLLLVMVFTAVACGIATEPPPIELSHRDSLVGAGKIVQIKNTSNEPLAEIEVLFRAPSGEERKFNQASLEPLAAFEVGWKKLDGWEIPEGTDVEVRCEGFLQSFAGRIE